MDGPSTTTVVDGSRPDARWDSFLAARPDGDLVQSTVWAATKASIGQLTRLTLRVRADGTVDGGALLVASRVAPAVRIGYVARGPVVDADRSDAPQVFDALVTDVVRDARAHGCRLVIVQPPGSPGPFDEVLARRGFRPGAPAVAPEATVRIDVTKSDDEILASMSYAASQASGPRRIRWGSEVERRSTTPIGRSAAIANSVYRTAVRAGKRFGSVSDAISWTARPTAGQWMVRPGATLMVRRWRWCAAASPRRGGCPR